MSSGRYQGTPPPPYVSSNCSPSSKVWLIGVNAKQIICTVATHMLKRVLTLFAPVYKPGQPDGRVLEVMKTCREWGKLKHATLEQWAKSLGEFKADSEVRYLDEREALLQQLADVGGPARSALLDLEKSYKPTEAAVNAVTVDGFTIDLRILQSHIYISTPVMDSLDDIYLKHYQTGGVYSLRYCFDIPGTSQEAKDALKKYMGYLGDVRKELLKQSNSRETAVALQAGDLQAVGLKNAVLKLDALFQPAPGRICLPLPTTSMLADLKVCLEFEEHILSEVRNSHAHLRQLPNSGFRSDAGLMASESTSF